MVTEVCEEIRRDTGLRTVVLSGGVFLNDFCLRAASLPLRMPASTSEPIRGADERRRSIARASGRGGLSSEGGIEMSFAEYHFADAPRSMDMFPA
ncbi:hypothetical protein [Cohnella faecalis]|uniref:hypothetical protein n=1 Tax=Cohnella faecalis TaxID=2315694 RepID=UPI00398A3953